MPSKRSSKIKVRFILPVTIRKRFSLLQTIKGINFGLVKMYMMPYRIFWILFTSDLVINKNITMSSFKISGDIQKTEGGPDSCFG